MEFTKEFVEKVVDEKREEMLDYLKEVHKETSFRPCFKGWVTSIYITSDGDFDYIERHNGNSYFTDEEHYKLFMNYDIGTGMDEILGDQCYPEDDRIEELLEVADFEFNIKDKVLKSIETYKIEHGESTDYEIRNFIENEYPDVYEYWIKDVIDTDWDNKERERLSDEFDRIVGDWYNV